MQSDEYKEISRRLATLETHLINLIVPIQNISHNLADPHLMRDLLKIFGEPLKIDDRALGGLLQQFRASMSEFRNDLEHFNITQTFDEIKYIGNRLKGIEEKIAAIQKEQKKKEVRLKVVVEGQERDENDQIIRDPLKRLLDVLPSYLQAIIINRAGLFREKAKTYKAIAETMHMSSPTVSIYHKQALRKLRHPDLKEIRDEVNPNDLKLIGI